MTNSEFWNIYKKYCKKNETASFSLKDYPLSGDHGEYEAAVFKNEEGIWCIESTIEHSNDSRHCEFSSEEECFAKLCGKYGWNLINIGFPREKLED